MGPGHDGGRIARLVRRAVRLLPVAVLMVLIWPAHWGGLMGMTMVVGDSMEPSLRTGDILLTLRHGSYDVGDVVQFEIPGLDGRRVVHRISEVAPDGTYRTRGDNRSTDDPWEIPSSRISGTSVAVIPRCEHRVCRGMSWPVLAMVGLLATSAALWTFDRLRQPVETPGVDDIDAREHIDA